MARSGNTTGLPALAVLASAVAVLPACIKEDPIITGNRDAAADARPVGPISPAPDEPEADTADCQRCADTLEGDLTRGTLCRASGTPSSAARFASLTDCACYDRCIRECGSFCGGGKRGDPCHACMLSQCSEQTTACIADKRP